MKAGEWAGTTVVCLASGPSLTDADVEFVRAWKAEDAASQRHVIAICTTFRKALWADVLYASDARWWRVYGAEAQRDFAGELWTGEQRLDGVNYIEAVDEPGLCMVPGRIHTGLNSAYQAMGLAYHWGPARIVLLGCDFQRGPNGESHHHGDHEGKLPNLGTLDKWVLCMGQMANDLRSQSIRVINASRRTALKCFDCMPIEQALGEKY